MAKICNITSSDIALASDVTLPEIAKKSEVALNSKIENDYSGDPKTGHAKT